MSFGAPNLAFNQGPIIPAGSRDVSASVGNLPSVGNEILEWAVPIVVKYVERRQSKGLTIERDDTVASMGVVQPFSNTALQAKPEGQRSWKWTMLHLAASLDVKNNDKISIADLTYRVMFYKDYSSYGYWYYELVEDYVSR